MRQSGVRIFSKIGVGALCATIVGGGAWAVVNELADDPVDCTVTEAPTFPEAQEIAEECGHDVGVLATYEPQARQVATPNKTAVAEFSAGAVRTDITGEWEEIDPTLVVDPATGEVKVASPLYDITLDPRGEDAFMRIADDGEAVSVRVPFELGAPVLDGSTAAWPVLDTAGGVIEGAVLKARVHADASGVTPVLEVRDREAYTQLSEAAGDADISFEFRSAGGIELEPDSKTGGFAAVGPNGEPTFVGGRALQWDSAGVGEATPVEAPTGAPGPTETKSADEVEAAQVEEVVLGEQADAIPVAGDAVAPLEVEVDGPDTITLVADEAMAQDPETVWPIAIDPPLSGVTINDWTALTTAGWQHYNDETDEGVGFCDVSKAASCGKDFKSRLFWDFTGMDLLKDLESADIQSAAFSAYGTHSYDCTKDDGVRLRLMETGVNSKTTWDSQPENVRSLSIDTTNFRAGCGGPSRAVWDATAGIKERAGKSTVNLRLSAVTESTMSSWRRYKMHTAQLTVEYNRDPGVPTSLALEEGGSGRAHACSTSPLTPNGRPTLTAIAKDPDKDKIKVAFELYDATTDKKKWGAETGFDTSGSKFSRTIPAASELGTGTYRWKAYAIDSAGNESAVSGACSFTVDSTNPGAPTIKPDATGSGFEAVYRQVGQVPVETGGKGMRGCFLIEPHEKDTDVSRVVYSGLNGSPGEVNVALSGAQLRVCHSAGAPLTTGPQDIKARVVDRAGNESTDTTYKLDVAVAREDGVWSFDGRSATVPDETTKDTGEDNPAGPLTVTAGSWANGPHLDFASRDGDYALNLNGTSTFGATKAPVFDTRESFVVSAHVMLGATDGTRTILSQDGLTGSAWSLRFQTAGCPAGTGAGCWAFSTFGKTGSVSKTVLSKVPVKASSWVHLTAEYDQRENKLRLWSCDVGTPAVPAPGVPVLDDAEGVPAMWQAPGPFVVGRGLTSGTGGDWFKGRIDNVRIFKGEVVAEAKVRRMCQGAEARDFSDGIDGLDPTMAVK